MTKEIEAIKGFYAAINQNDIEGALKFLSPDIVRTEPAQFPAPGTFRGQEELRAHITHGRGTWAEGGCAPERFEFFGDKILVHVHVKVRLKEKTDWLDGYAWDGYRFQNDKIFEFHTFFENKKALEWAHLQQT